MKERRLLSVELVQKRRSLAFFLLPPLLVFLAWLYLPATRGDFVADDYVFIATARMVDTPLAAFWQSHFYEPYYFRPLGVLSWWVATRLFGLDYSAHSLINLSLHAANVSVLWLLLRALALRTEAVIAGVVLFALGPFSLATILWPSNRFDLLAVGFLLLQAIAMLRMLRGNLLALPLAMLAALAACWSKELAYPVATALTCLSLGASGVEWQRRIVFFGLLSSTIAGAFFVRRVIVTDAYFLASADPIGQILAGAATMVLLLPKLTELIIGGERLPWLAGGLLTALLAALIWRRGVTRASILLLAGAVLVAMAAFIVQTPLAKNFAIMLDGNSFGTVTFARFYYAPWAAACVAMALLVADARLSKIVALTIVSTTLVAALAARPLPEAFARWTRDEVRPVSLAATEAIESGIVSNQPCVFVFLGTQAAHPYFRMFSDVTVKARTTMPDAVWRCYVMTESTPWLFAFPSSLSPVDLPLRAIETGNGLSKLDSTWSSIRYRYRLPTESLSTLPDARFFGWRGNRFTDVTDQVRQGKLEPKSQNW
ncbi:MAG: hypothetical protein H7203_15725 [Rhizobacter sp.]|nr:hypothetical protein [Burkholderiales bacterium]